MQPPRLRQIANIRLTWRYPSNPDWAEIALVAVFLAVLPLPGWVGALPWLFGLLQSRPYDQYENAIRAAAVKTPASAMTLTRLDPSAPETQVIKFGYVPTADANPVKGGQIKTEIFVALPDELKQRCKGAADPRTALYQPSETMTHDLVAKTSWPGLARPSRSARAAIDGRPVTRP